MIRDYDIDDILYFARRGMSAAWIKEELSLRISERQIQRLIASRLGPRPTRRSVDREDILRARVEAYMVTQGLNPRHCASCRRVQVRPGFIRAISPDLSLDALVFICAKCAAPGDV